MKMSLYLKVFFTANNRVGQNIDNLKNFPTCWENSKFVDMSSGSKQQ